MPYTVPNTDTCAAQPPGPWQIKTSPSPHEEGERQVRLTAQRILTEHLRDEPTTEEYDTDQPADLRFWDGMRIDLTGATLINLHFLNCRMVESVFRKSTFSGDAVFIGANFAGSAWFERTTFTWNTSFQRTTFTSNATFGGKGVRISSQEATISGRRDGPSLSNRMELVFSNHRRKLPPLQQTRLIQMVMPTSDLCGSVRATAPDYSTPLECVGDPALGSFVLAEDALSVD
ncbi:pentapeptide repeat-containing protein [Streptosporangium sp. NPDC020072]|uniref:pentapeptide repeat-containing protein n=1 Tax=Streptosporangium sp. NPDC020072 TaxID=3154788 RepID=UPI003444F24A